MGAWRNKEGFLEAGVLSEVLKDKELVKSRRSKKNPCKAGTQRSMGLSCFSLSGEEELTAFVQLSF